MDELLNLGRGKPGGTVKGNIDRFETLSLSESTTKPRSSSIKSKTSIVDITASSSNDGTSLRSSADVAPSLVSKASSETSVTVDPPAKTTKKRESVAFVSKSYLEDNSKNEQDTLPDDAREILKSQPDYEDLLAVLQYLECGIKNKHDFNIHMTGPKASQILNALVTVTIPDHWPVLRIHKLPKRQEQLKRLIVVNLRSVAGIGALIMQVRRLGSIRQADSTVLEDTLCVLELVLRGSQFLNTMINDARKLYLKEVSRRISWQELVSLVAGSKILSYVAQATTTAGLSSNKLKWLSDGDEYNKWLAKNVSVVAGFLSIEDTEAWTMLAMIVKRAFNLGYRDTFVSELYSSLLLGKVALWTPVRQLLHHLTDQEQRLFFDAMLRDLVRKYLRYGPVTHSMQQNGLESESNVGGVAAMMAGVMKNNAVLEEHLVSWLTSTTGEYANLGLDTRRAVIATLALRQDKLQMILDKCLENFGNKIHIQHSPILQQESMTEIILLTIAYINRQDPTAIKKLSQSRLFLQTVSNRLSASVSRARILGMLVATAVSRLADGSDKAMNFGMEELESQAAQKWLDLVNVQDEVGSIDSLKVPMETTKPMILDLAGPTTKSKAPAQPERSKIIAIEEIEDEDEISEDEDLVPYQKPDEDPSDSDDDPTLINRDKPSPPVYIINLIKQLQDDDKLDVVELALKTAPSLIRRKANFGTEVSDNVLVLASTLLNLKSPTLDGDEMHNLRLQALVACLVSQPTIIAPWLAAMYFEGDYSLDQRASILSTLGLGAREIAGLSTSSSTPTTTDNDRDRDGTPFPSRRLPSHTTALSPSYTTPLSTATATIAHNTMQPLALRAADKLSGPDILKIRTFSSRMAVQARTAASAAERTKRIPRDLHKLLAESFFLPLAARLALVLSSTAVGRSNIFESNIVRLYLQTLVVVLNALGPNALYSLLGECSRQAIEVLIALQTRVVRLALDPVVLPAMMLLLLSVLEINIENGRSREERLLAEDVGGEGLVRLVLWVGELLERKDNMAEAGEGEGGGMAWHVLAAGVMVRWSEVRGRWQGRVMGLLGVEDGVWEG